MRAEAVSVTPLPLRITDFHSFTEEKNMDHNGNNDMSAEEILARLKASTAGTSGGKKSTEKGKRYKFRKTLKQSPKKAEDTVTDDELDVDALMRKYLSEEEYEVVTRRYKAKDDDSEEELVKSLEQIDELDDGELSLDSEDDDSSVASDGEYTAPDGEVFSMLSAGGKVCDIPELDGDNGKDDTDGKTAVYTDADEDTLPFVKVIDADDTDSDDKFSATDIFASSDDRESDDELDSEDDLTDSEDDIIIPASDGTGGDLENTTVVNGVMRVSADRSDDLTKTAVFDESLYIGDTDSENADGEDGDMTLASVDTDGEDGDMTVISDGADSEDDDISIFTADNIGISDTSDDDIFSLTDEQRKDIEGDDIDETDANLMIAFGMDEELELALGKDRAEKIVSDNRDEVSDDGDDDSDDEDDIPEREYISPVETKEIKEKYKNEFGRNVLSLFGIGGVAVILFFYENITLFGGSLPEALSPRYYPIVNVMIGLQLLVLAFAVGYKTLWKGIRGLTTKKPVPESFLPVILLISLIYAVVSCFFPIGAVPSTYFFPATLALLLAVYNERLDLRREIMSFNTVSSKMNKFALEKLELDEAELETKAFDKFLPKKTSVFKINKTAFVDGYFRRTRAYPSAKHILKAFIPASVAIFVAAVVAGTIIMKNFPDAFTFAYSVFFFSLPGAIFLSFGMPSFRAARIAYREGSAFIGEAALDEYTSAGSISFDDRDVFPTGGVKLRSVKVFGSGRLDTVIYTAASVYSFIGGPLSDVLNVATADFGRSDNAEIISVDNEGIDAVVDGKHIYLGKANYLRRKGYVPVSDPDDEDIAANGEMSIMYLVADDEVIAKLYIKYRLDPSFENTIKRLYKSGICVGIKTVDPNIDDEMLGTKIKLEKYPVRVLKYNDIAEGKRGADRTDSGIVSKKSAKSLLRVFTLCDKIKHVTKTNLAVDLLTVIAGLIICSAVAIIGNAAAVPSIFVALFQIFWIVPVYLMSKFMLL